ncbi:MAG: cysteine desulfurase family protein [Firmicutes bacterium]|nr:cysteine desulfurase family protein [Bacillota bacterium]
MHYLDNSATTPLCRESAERMKEYMDSHFGNPSSLHRLGSEAQMRMDDARRSVARAIGCDSREVYFTSCGSEADNTAVLGAARARRRAGRRVITTAVEHSAVLESMKQLEREGFEVIYLKPDSGGNISEQSLADAVNGDTVLVSMMLVNNESGARLPVERIRPICRDAGADPLIHCDAVQAFGRMSVRPDRLGVDLMSISAHKVHGPKGIGALYVARGKRILPLILGGGQERGMRSGTESTLLCEGFAAACDALPGYDEQNGLYTALRERILRRAAECDGVTVNSPPDAVPYITNISVRGIRSETMMHFLEERDVFVSSGSACSKGAVSHVLVSMGLDRGDIDSALRISLSRMNTAEDIDRLFDGIEAAKQRLRRRR